MKTLKRVLIIILVVLILLIGGILGFMWYRNNHIFVEDAVYPIHAESLDLREEEISFDHYESVRRQLPDCEILWSVPFQSTKYASNSESVSVKILTQEDVAILKTYLPDLKKVDASACADYSILEYLKEQLPGVEVIYQVTLGSQSYAPDATELELESCDYDFDTLLENLKYLPQVTAITLHKPELSQEQIDQLEEAYENIAFTFTVEILGREYDMQTTELDLSALSSADVEETSEKLSLLPNLTAVELMAADGTSSLSKEDVKVLMDAAPEAVFNYSFDFYGYTLSTADEEVHIKNKKIGDEGVEDVRAVLDIMTNCKRFVLEYCQISYDILAEIRDEYRDRTKVVWRVDFGRGSTLTDAEVIRAVYDLVDDNCQNLIYCEDVRYMDLGHNEWLDACDFVAGMPNLEYLIISGAPIKSLEPFRNCKKLKFLEIAFCEYIEDLSPLADCVSLEMLNISNTHAIDLSPLDELPLTHLCARIYPSGNCRVPQEEQDRFIAQHPDCWSSFTGKQPYGAGWRYTEDEKDYLDYYKLLRKVFRYELDPNIPNHVGWYLKDEETTYKD